MRSVAVLIAILSIALTACWTRTRYIDRPVEILVPVAAPEVEKCPSREPPVRPTGVFSKCVMPEIVACLTRDHLEALTLYLEESQEWFASYGECYRDTDKKIDASLGGQ